MICPLYAGEPGTENVMHEASGAFQNAGTETKLSINTKEGRQTQEC